MPDPEKKYVVFVVPGIYPCSTGGMEIFYSKLLPEIAGKEDVILITKCGQAVHESFTTIHMPERILSLPGTGRFATLLFTAMALAGIRKQIKIVHLPYTSNSGQWGFVFPLLNRLFGIRYLLHIHGGGMRKWKKLNADKTLFKIAARILAVSETTKTEYEKRSGRNIEIVLPLVPFETTVESREALRKKHHMDPHDRVILFVGSLKELKAPDVVLEAFVRLGDKFVSANRLKLIFVGSGPLSASLKNRVNSLRWGKRVIFTGLVPYAEIPQYYRLADIYVISSHFEGTPKSLLEAMFNRLPIIGADVNGINSILTHNVNALLFEKDNADQLRQCMKDLVTDTDKAEVLSKEALARFNEGYNFDNTVVQLEKIYNDGSVK
jgi:glycosyltransferase involved in cell wall biosynthesis